MIKRALLALLVLQGLLAFAQPAAGDAPVPWTQQFYLATNIYEPHSLAATAPASNGSVDLGRNGSAEFVMTNVSGIYNSTDGVFRLELGFVSLNISGLELDIKLYIDWLGNGTYGAVPFGSYATTIAKETERATLTAKPSATALKDIRMGTLRLVVSRLDSMDVWVRLLCGNGGNMSRLTLPYSPGLGADAGPDQTAHINTPVQFNSSRSRIIDPDNTIHEWTVEGAGQMVNLTGKQAVYSFEKGGVYNVTLRLKWRGHESTDIMRVSVTSNLPPTADAGRDISNQKRGVPISFHGSGNDSDGIIVMYQWNFGDGTTALGRNVTHAYTLSGNFTVTLTITDDGGLTASDTLRVHINYPPTLTINATNTTGRSISFRAYATDPDDPVLSYRWDFGDGEMEVGASPVHNFDSSGTFRVSCTVSDDIRENTTAYMNITIGNSPPMINGITTSGEANVDQYVTFIPSLYDPDGDAMSYSWSFGDGTASQEQSPRHAYTRAGTFTVSFTATDTFGNSASVQMTVKVSEGGSGGDLGGSAMYFALSGIVIIVVIVAVLMVLLRSKPGAPGQAGTGVFQPGMGQAPPTYGYQPPVQSRPPMGITPPGLAPSASQRPRRTARAATAPGVCPRCDSPNLQGFEDGHSKCRDCKKILFTE